MQPNPPTTTPPPPYAQPVQSDTTAKIVYILYLATFLSGVTALIGVVMAYVNVGDAPEPLRSHYRFQIRTFWIALLYCVIGSILALVGIGFLILLFVAIWAIVRCVKGLQYVSRHEPYPNVTTWLW